jgi:ABC-type multidrug transport system fused ATPase/permease subunit
LFSGTIYQNVVDGLTGTPLIDLPDEEKRRMVVDACQSAYAHDFIETLPNVRSPIQVWHVLTDFIIGLRYLDR